MSKTTVPLSRAWNTWTSERPAEMVFLPLGIRLTPLLYTASSETLADFSVAGDIALGPRTIDAASVELLLWHGRTSLRWCYRKPDAFTLCGAWRKEALGEWGLRVWVVLCLETENGDDWIYDSESGELSARIGHRHVVLACAAKPLLVTFHESRQALTAEFADQGYFYLGSRGVRGRVAALRFNLEETPSGQFAMALADARQLASRRARSVLGVEVTPADLPERGEALAAVRDVVAWNTVWDAVNQRPYTALSRRWNTRKFGGFGVWLDDVFYHALLAGLCDGQLVRENLAAVLAGATPQGNLPCLLTGNDAWVDRSQPPIGAFVVWMLYLRSGQRDLLELAYPALRDNHEWWWRERDGNGDGLLEYGSSAVGDGLYAGTALAARNESSMDNSPVHDEATWVAETGTLDCADVGLNSLLALDAEMLSSIAATLGDTAAAKGFAECAARQRVRIGTQLWDETRGIFANRLWSGRFVRSLAPTSFYPLLAGAATPEQAKAMIENWLLAPGRFGGDWLLPAVSRDDPACADNVYWRGRIWPPLHFLVYYGLRRYGHEAVAAELAANGYRLFGKAWRERLCPENFNAVTGAALDQPDTDGFYGWGALLPYIAIAETADINPWEGWSLNNTGEDDELGPMPSPVGRAVVERREGILSLSVDGTVVLRSAIPGRLRGLQLGKGRFRVVLPAGVRPGCWLEFPGIVPAQVLLARLGDEAVAAASASPGSRIVITQPLDIATPLMVCFEESGAG